MNKKFGYGIATLLLASTALAGCGGNAANNDAGSTGAASPAAGSAAPAKDVTIKVIGLSSTEADKVKTLVSDYEASHPGVKVDFEIPPADQESTLYKTRFASGDAPDIFFIDAASIPAWADRLADLSDEPWMAHVLPEGLRHISIDGKKVGFPWKIEGSGIIYNKDLFAKAGITEIPKTQTELKQAAEKLKAAGIQPFGEAWKNWGFLMHLLGVPFAYEADETAFVNDVNSGAKQIKDLTYADDFFKTLDLTVDYGLGKASIGYDVTQQFADFANGKMAMIKQGTWFNTLLMQQNPNLKFGMFAVPLTDDPAQTKLEVASTSYFVVNKDSKYLAESKEFLNWLHENGQKYIVDMFKMMPVFDDLQGGELGPLFDDMNTYIEANNTYDNFGIESWPAGFAQEMAKPLQAYISGVYTKEQALEEMQSLWTQNVKQ